MQLGKILVSGLFFLVAGCEQPSTNVDSSSIAVVGGAEQPCSLEKTTSRPVTKPTVTAKDLHIRIKTIASDRLAGRRPAIPCEGVTLDHLVDQFKTIGLSPASETGYLQEVPLVELTANPDVQLTVSRADRKRDYIYKDDMIVWTNRMVNQVNIEQSEMVFVGYGIVAPEYGWDDYAGIDVTGKTVVMLVNDPGFATQDPAIFKGNTMTYYGRWTYKYEEAARQGAAAALIIHETAPAAYPWTTVQTTWGGSHLGLVAVDKNMSKVGIEGWVSLETGQDIVHRSGYDYGALKLRAAKKGFTPFLLNATASMTLNSSYEISMSHNVIGYIPGSVRPDEFILYMAHWDHFGQDPELLSEDKIYNGALDNATGVAALLEIAEAFSNMEKPPERSVVFVSTTAEEYGLLGSEYYAKSPPFPLGQTVAGINIDGLNIIGRTHDMAVIGAGLSELEGYLARALAVKGRIVIPEAFPEKGYYYRSDHFNLAKKGVPMLYAGSGMDSLDHGREWGMQQAENYVSRNYHQTSDNYDPEWDLTGAAEDVMIYVTVGQTLANEQRWPNWNQGTEFRAIRDRMR